MLYVNLETDTITETPMDMPKPFVDPVVAKGHALLELFDADGVLKESQEINNLIVASGLAWMAKKFAGESTNEMTHIAVGTSSAATSTGQTALVGSELGRVAITTKTRTNNQVVAVATFPAGTGTGTLNEAAIFDGASGTTMFSRLVFGGSVAKGAADSFQITWTLTFNAA